ncbi:MAG: hypothetical protein KJ064_17805 [Anaerolineae bacterium]|nr:hypothetical protein [Anaerolineae bacterium]
MNESSQQRNVIYIPPETEAIETYARTVCKTFAEKHDTAYGSPEMIEGFTTFMKLVVRVKLKHLHRDATRENKMLVR